MRQPIRVVVAAVAAVAALSIAVAATSSAATPPTPSEHPPSAPGTATCVIQHPDCNDMGFGSSGSAPGSPGSGVAAPPPVVDPSPVCGSKHVSASGPDATVATLPCVPGPAPRPQPLIVVPRSGMANVRPIAFSSAAVRPDGRTVDVRFWSGVQAAVVKYRQPRALRPEGGKPRSSLHEIALTAWDGLRVARALTSRYSDLRARMRPTIEGLIEEGRR